MENQPSTAENSTATSTNPAVDALVSRAMDAIRDPSTLYVRTNMTLPVNYEQFCALVKAQAERIMREQGKEHEYTIDSNIEAVMRRIYGFTQSGSRKGIALVGKYGCGKTLILRSYIAVHNALVNLSDGKLRRGLYQDTSSTRLFKDLADRDLFDRLCRCPLFIDELGREPMSGKHFGTETTPVIDLLFERWNYGAITHITANKTLETLSNNEHYGAMTGSRLHDMFVFIQMGGDDRRRKQSDNQ